MPESNVQIHKSPERVFPGRAGGRMEKGIGVLPRGKAPVPLRPAAGAPRPQGGFLTAVKHNWRKITGGAILLAILVHVVFGLIAAVLVISRWSAKPKPAPPREMAVQRSESVKISVDRRSKTMSAPAVKKRVTTADSLSKVALPEMPTMPGEIVTPAVMPGVSANFGTGPDFGGGFGAGNGVADTTVFGTPGGKIGLKGTFYDLKQTRSRKKVDEISMKRYGEVIAGFSTGGWKEDFLAQYYRIRHAVASKMIFIPLTPAEDGPKAFRVDDRVKPTMWIVHYRGQVVPPQGGTYRFIGAGDNVMLVGINGKLVLDRCWNHPIIPSTGSFDYHDEYSRIPRKIGEGSPVTVVAGQKYQIDVLIGEEPGVHFFAFLLIEKEGVTPKTNPQGQPLFPIFRFAAAPEPKITADVPVPPHDPDMPAWSVWNVVSDSGFSIDTDSIFRQ